MNIDNINLDLIQIKIIFLLKNLKERDRCLEYLSIKKKCDFTFIYKFFLKLKENSNVKDC